MSKLMIKYGVNNLPKQPYDWLGFAIGELGGPELAANRLKVDRKTIYNWLEKGLGPVSFEQVLALSDASEIPLEAFRKRLGPYPYGAPPDERQDPTNDGTAS
jgi:hypothetical protein